MLICIAGLLAYNGPTNLVRPKWSDQNIKSEQERIVASTGSRVDEVYSVLRTEILTGQYRKGERLPSERDLAARFEVSRGAVREVIKKLEQLGIIEVTPGGVRITPVEEATLDVLGYLLELDDATRPELIGQMLDVLGAMFSLSVRAAMNKASNAERIEIADAAGNLLESLEHNDEEQHHLAWQNLGEKLIGIHQNLVLKLIGNGLRTQFMGQIRRENFENDIDVAGIINALGKLERSIRIGAVDEAGNAIIEHFGHMKAAVLKHGATQGEDKRIADYG